MGLSVGEWLILDNPNCQLHEKQQNTKTCTVGKPPPKKGRKCNDRSEKKVNGKKTCGHLAAAAAAADASVLIY